MVTGIVQWDLNGENYLTTFDGVFKIPSEALTQLVQHESARDFPGESISGRLARAETNGKCVLVGTLQLLMFHRQRGFVVVGGNGEGEA